MARRTDAPKCKNELWALWGSCFCRLLLLLLLLLFFFCMLFMWDWPEMLHVHMDLIYKDETRWPGEADLRICPTWSQSGLKTSLSLWCNGTFQIKTCGCAPGWTSFTLINTKHPEAFVLVTFGQISGWLDVNGKTDMNSSQPEFINTLLLSFVY